MSNSDPSGTDWSSHEINLIVADYFDMLRMELAKEPYVKAHRNMALQELTGRSRGSIEFKHQNISAVLVELELPWVAGYKPMANFQKALLDGIEQYLLQRIDIFHLPQEETNMGVSEIPTLLFEQPPERNTVIPIPDSEPLKRLVKKFDPAERDARNRALGKRGEELIFFSEQAHLRSVGREDLSKRVRWVSEEDGDGAGYDILSFNNAGDERLLEVKTTTGRRTAPFFLSENERLLSIERTDEFRLVRLYNFMKEPRAFKLTPPIDNYVDLAPVSYRASFIV